MSKKILSMLLVLTMLVGIIAAMPLTASAADDVWDGTSDPSFFTDGSGNGTASNPFKISTPEQWYAFVKWSNNELTISEVPRDDYLHFELTADLKFNEGNAADWASGSSTPDNTNLEPAFSYEKAGKWCVMFNGNGHTISGAYINIADNEGAGLFGQLWGQHDKEETTALVENLIIENSYFYASQGWVGAVIGEVCGSTTVRNIYVKDDVYVKSGSNVAGGLIGGTYHTGPYTTTINDCIFAGTVDSVGDSNGGLLGNGNSSKGKVHSIKINNCLVTGNISTTLTSKTRTSGFVGYNYYNSGDLANSIKNSIFAGSLTNQYSVFADQGNLTVENCYSTLGGNMWCDDYHNGDRADTSADVNVTIVTRDQLIGMDAIDVTGFRKLEGEMMMPKGVANLLYPAADGKVVFKNWDGEILQETDYAGGDMPEYTGKTPTRPATNIFSYEFAGWDPTLETVNGAAEYTATFTETLIVEALTQVGDKYYINNVNQYLYFMNNVSEYKGKTVVVGADLDFEGTEGIIKPIKGFAGTFDGNGHTLSNITMKMSDKTEVALFADITTEVTIQNLVIRSSTFEAKQWMATLVSSTNSKNLVIRNVYIAPDVTVKCGKSSSNSYAGGLIGGVYGDNAGANVTVDNCIFAGTVSATGQYAAGIIGQVGGTGNTTTITNCLNAGSVSSATTQAAGIATGSGGLTIENCVNAGKVSISASANLVGGIFTGNVASDVIVKNNYTIGAAATYTSENNIEITAENNQENLRKAALMGNSSVVALERWTKVDGDFAMPDGAKVYVTETLYKPDFVYRGEGTKEDPILIADADEWLLLVDGAPDYNNYSGMYIKLENDIDFDGVELVPFSGFKGTLDGNGKVLKNIYMTKASGKGDVALFDALGDNATIKNFSIVSSTFEIKGNANWVGTVACCTNGKNVTISNVYVGKDVKVIAGKADGNSIAGGILGGVYGSVEASVLVENCVFAGTVTGTGDSVAGIVASVEQKVAEGVAFNTVTVRNCLNAGIVEGDNHVAGIISGQGMTVENCVNAGTVRSKGKIVAAIAASNPNTTVVVDGCYYANGALMAFGDRGDSLVEYGTNVYVGINELTGSNAKAPETFTKRSGDLAIPTGCTNVSETLVKISLVDGAAVRLDDPSGIRFTAVLGGAYLNSFMGEGKDVSFGIIITPKDYVEAAGAFTIEDLTALGHKVNYKEIAANKLLNDAETDESYVYTGVLAPIQEGNYGRAWSAIAYIKVVENGVATYYYSDYDEAINSRSIAEVAEKAYKDTSTTQNDRYQYLLNDGLTADEAIYSPYTATQRNILLNFYKTEGAIDVSFLSYNIRNVEDTSGWLDRPTFEYTNRENYVRDYLVNYDADVVGLQEAAWLKATLGSLDWFDTIGDADTNAGLTAAGYTCVKGEDIYGGENPDKRMYNPIYYKTGKYDLVANGTKWLTSTPDTPSTIDGADTTKALNYVVLEDKASGQQFVYVNLHLIVRRSNYVHDAEGNDTTFYVQQLEVIYLRAILDDLQEQYPELPMFVGGDFNNSYTGINNWFKYSIVGENDWEIEGDDTDKRTPTEDIILTNARNEAVCKTTTRYSCTTDDFTEINPEAIAENWGAIDLWYVSNFDGVVYVYEIIDNKNETVGKYPSDHLPARMYVTIYK